MELARERAGGGGCNFGRLYLLSRQTWQGLLYGDGKSATPPPKPRFHPAPAREPAGLVLIEANWGDRGATPLEPSTQFALWRSEVSKGKAFDRIISTLKERLGFSAE